MTPEEWQKRLDEDFPRGMVVQIGDDDDMRFRTTGFAVVGESGDNPVLRCLSDSTDKDFTATPTSYEVVRTDPVTVATLDQADGPSLIFGGNISEEEGKEWDDLRKEQRAMLLQLGWYQ